MKNCFALGFGAVCVASSVAGNYLFYFPGLGQSYMTEMLPQKVVLFSLVLVWTMPFLKSFFRRIAVLSGFAFPCCFILFFSTTSTKMGLLRQQVLPVVQQPIDTKLLPGLYVTEKSPNSVLELRSDGTCTVGHLADSWRYLHGHDGYNTFSGNWHLTDYLVTNNQTITCVVITTDSLPQRSGSDLDTETLKDCPEFEITRLQGHDGYCLGLQTDIENLSYLIFIKKK